MSDELRDRFGKPVPVSVRDWHWHAVCPRCGWHAPAHGGTTESLIVRTCWKCGLPVSSALIVRIDTVGRRPGTLAVLEPESVTGGDLQIFGARTRVVVQ